jgi:hypothetical protein
MRWWTIRESCGHDAGNPVAKRTETVGGEVMNDIDYRSTLECLRIAARLIMPLDLDGFLERVAALEEHEAGHQSLSVGRLARIAKAMRD